MSGWGLRCKNSSNGYVTIDENLRAFVYLGKYPINSLAGVLQTIDISCVGFPMVFCDIPYGVVDSGVPTSGLNSFYQRYGSHVASVKSIGTNTWRVTVMLNNPGNRDLGMFIRVFGYLHLNHPNGSGEHWGARVRNPQRELVFDTGFRMLKLAGNSYDAELVLPWQVPNQYDANNSQDTAIAVPFDMAGKSICATARGVIHWPYNIGGYSGYDGEPDHVIYDVLAFYSMYASTGSTINVRRIALGSDRMDVVGGMGIDTSNCQTVFSRLAIIDNSQFP